jgi:hypothetical protein
MQKKPQDMTYQELVDFLGSGVSAQKNAEVFSAIQSAPKDTLNRFELRQNAELSHIWGGVLSMRMTLELQNRLQPA